MIEIEYKTPKDILNKLGMMVDRINKATELDVAFASGFLQACFELYLHITGKPMVKRWPHQTEDIE